MNDTLKNKTKTDTVLKDMVTMVRLEKLKERRKELTGFSKITGTTNMLMDVLLMKIIETDKEIIKLKNFGMELSDDAFTDAYLDLVEKGFFE
jgi:hypothetical protein